METHAEHRILSADRCGRGVMIVFDDGKTAVYPATMLYASLSQIADVINGDGPEELEG
jgi:hypothetical protein